MEKRFAVVFAIAVSCFEAVAWRKIYVWSQTELLITVSAHEQSRYRGTAYTIDSRDASNEETPATIIVACVNFCPVPPESPPIVASVVRSYDAFEISWQKWKSMLKERPSLCN